MKKLLYSFLFAGLPICYSGAPAAVEGVSVQKAQATILIQDSEAADPVIAKHEAARLIAAAGFPTHVVPVMTCLAEYESHFHTKAVNENSNHSRDYGLLQINSIWLKKKGCNMMAKDLLDPIKNTQCAYQVYKAQGLEAWTTYQTYKEACLAYSLDNPTTEKIMMAAAKVGNSP